MAVPKCHDFIPHITSCLNDGNVHNLKDISKYCAEQMRMSEADKSEVISSGMPKYRVRLNIALNELKKVGLVENTQRGQYILTEAGISACRHESGTVTFDYIKSIDPYKIIRDISKSSDPTPDEDKQIDRENEKTESPQEQMESALSELNNDLADDLMSEIMKISPYEFERLVAKLLIAMGYGTLEGNPDAVTKKSGDEGIDGVVSADKFGFDSIYIQAKQWQPDSAVSRPEVQKFLGALAGQGASKGIFITTARFSKESREFAAKQLHSKIVLVDGMQLTRLMIEYDLGVSTVATYKVKRIDSDFFDEYT